jgi:hypothetical protein
MITDRLIEAGDEELLAASLEKDEYHATTKPEFFVAPNTICKVYEDGAGPICFVRGSAALRLDIQYVDNGDRKRNMQAMLGGFPDLAMKAKENGFSEIIFQTNNPLLSKFCVTAFGFTESKGELRKLL